MTRITGPLPSDRPAPPDQGGADRRAGAAEVPQEVHLGGARGLPIRRRTDAEQPQLNQEQAKPKLVDLNHPLFLVQSLSPFKDLGHYRVNLVVVHLGWVD